MPNRSSGLEHRFRSQDNVRTRFNQFFCNNIFGPKLVLKADNFNLLTPEPSDHNARVGVTQGSEDLAIIRSHGHDAIQAESPAIEEVVG